MDIGETIFHKIIRKEIPADIVHEDDLCVAFRDINPISPVHVLIVPKQTIPSLRESSDAHRQVLGHLLLVAASLAKKEGLDEGGYRVVINSGENAGQTVFQLHLHLLGGRDFRWPPG